MASNQCFSKHDGSPLSDITTYQSIVGKLLYLTYTRPDLSFAVQQLSQFLDCLTNVHLAATHRALHYLKGTPGQGLFFPSINDFHLRAFSDSDWGTCLDTRHSITGYCVFLGHALIS